VCVVCVYVVVCVTETVLPSGFTSIIKKDNRKTIITPMMKMAKVARPIVKP